MIPRVPYSGGSLVRAPAPAVLPSRASAGPAARVSPFRPAGRSPLRKQFRKLTRFTVRRGGHKSRSPTKRTLNIFFISLYIFKKHILTVVLTGRKGKLSIIICDGLLLTINMTYLSSLMSALFVLLKINLGVSARQTLLAFARKAKR